MSRAKSGWGGNEGLLDREVGRGTVSNEPRGRRELVAHVSKDGPMVGALLEPTRKQVRQKFGDQLQGSQNCRWESVLWEALVPDLLKKFGYRDHRNSPLDCLLRLAGK